MEKLWMLTKLFLTVVFLYFLNSCSAQIKYDCIIKDIEVSIWEPETEDYQRIEFTNNIMLVFQKGFNDTINIYIEDSLLSTKYYKTNSNLSVVPIFDKIEGTLYEDGKEVRIFLTGKNECVKFKIIKGYSFAYFTKDEYGKWFIEFSKYKRKYY